MPSVATALLGASATVGKPSVLRFVKTQGPWLALVLAAIGGGQWLVLHDSAAPIVSSDGLLYISNANQITSLHGLVDPKMVVFQGDRKVLLGDMVRILNTAKAAGAATIAIAAKRATGAQIQNNAPSGG